RIFESDPLDKNALSEGLARLVDVEVKLRQAPAALTTELAESMTAEERRAFVKWQEERRRQRFRSSGRRNDGGTRSADQFGNDAVVVDADLIPTYNRPAARRCS